MLWVCRYAVSEVESEIGHRFSIRFDQSYEMTMTDVEIFS